MRIVVLVKQVPEISELRLDPETRRLRRDGVDAMMNPFDRRAMLEAHRLRAETGGSITVLTMGPPQAERVLRECLGLGAQRAVHLCDRGFAGADTLATARALGAAVRRIGFDLLLAGRYSIDSETGQVGPEIAALLRVPFLGGVRKLDVSPTAGGWAAFAECEGDDGFTLVDGPLPLVVTCTDRWQTRVPRVLPDDEASANGPVEVWPVDALDGAASDYGADGSPTWVGEVQPVVSERRGVRAVYVDEPARVLAELRRELDRGGPGAPPRRTATLQHARPADPSAPRLWVLGERGPTGDIRPVTWELLSTADRLAAALGGATALFLLEAPMPEGDVPAREPLEALTAEVGARGGDELLVSQAPPHAHADVLTRAIGEYGPRLVLAPATALGRDVVPQVAARLGLGLTGDAIGVELDDEGRLQQLKPAFGGQVVAPILSRTRPEMATLRPGVLELAAADPSRAAADVIELASTSAEAVIRIRQFEPEVSGADALLEEARVVVCVGFGLGKAGVDKARELAHILGGAVAGTRRVCDLKWLPRQAQIGLSGRSVAPDVYLALGVRGSFNHMVGLRRAGAILAVNNDPDAEIFESADLGVVADAPTVLDDLLAAYGSG